MTKLSDAQIKVLESVHATGELPKGTRQATLTKLREELGFLLITTIGDETNYTLTTEGREAIGIKTEADGDFTPENIARAIEDIESSESDETPIPFFNRAARREVRRNVARYNRRLMREHGKRVRKFGPQNVIIKFIAA